MRNTNTLQHSTKNKIKRSEQSEIKTEVVACRRDKRNGASNIGQLLATNKEARRETASKIAMYETRRSHPSRNRHTHYVIMYVMREVNGLCATILRRVHCACVLNCARACWLRLCSKRAEKHVRTRGFNPLRNTHVTMQHSLFLFKNSTHKASRELHGRAQQNKVTKRRMEYFVGLERVHLSRRDFHARLFSSSLFFPCRKNGNVASCASSTACAPHLHAYRRCNRECIVLYAKCHPERRRVPEAGKRATRTLIAPLRLKRMRQRRAPANRRYEIANHAITNANVTAYAEAIETKAPYVSARRSQTILLCAQFCSER